MDDSTVSESVSVPPYAAWAYFERLIQRAGSEDVPARIDKKLLQAWGIAAGNESSLVTSLHTLGLIDRQGRPTPDFRALRLSAPRRREALQRAFERAYPGLPYDLDPPISDDELHDYFVDERGLTGQMVQKAMRFYRRLAEVARDPALGDERAAPSSRPGPHRSPAIIGAPEDPTLVGPGTETAEAAGDGEDEATPPEAWTAGAPEVSSAALTLAPDLSAQEDAPPDRARSPRPTLSVNLSVAITPDTSDEELEALFRRVRRAWERVFGSEPPTRGGGVRG